MEEEQKIRVLIADDVAETRDILEKALYFEKDIQVIGKAANGREAVQMARQLQPDVVLMDINMPEMDGIAATEAIMAQVPGTQVIIMSVQNEMEYVRRAMMAGAREYLIKPPDTDQLASSIRHVGRLASSTRTLVGGGTQTTAKSAETGKIIAIFSPKGGAGCTATAVNLAVALRQRTNKKVVLMDANMAFGDIGVAMNIVANKNILDLANRASELDAQLIGDVTVPHATQVRVLLAPSNSQSDESITPEQMRAVLEGLRTQFDYTIVDTATAYDDRTLAVLDVADRVMVLLSQELAAIKNVKQFMELAGPLGYANDKLMLVLNRADPRMNIRAESIEAQLRQRFVAQVGNAQHQMALALNQGVPFVLHERNHAVTRDYLNLAAVVANMFAPSTAPAAAVPAPAAVAVAPARPENKGLFGRLTNKR